MHWFQTCIIIHSCRAAKVIFITFRKRLYLHLICGLVDESVSCGWVKLIMAVMQ